MESVTPLEAVDIISSGDRVFIQGGAATPQELVKAMAERSCDFRNVEIVHIHTEGTAPYTTNECRDSFIINSFFIGSNLRNAVKQGYAQYIPMFLSEIPALFRYNTLPLDVALVQVSPPDKHGYCSLGVSVDVAITAVEMAKYVIAQINPQMPRTHGDGLVHIRNFHACCEVDTPIPEVIASEPTSIEKSIGNNVAELVEDRATLQMGIGGIPNAVLGCLKQS